MRGMASFFSKLAAIAVACLGLMFGAVSAKAENAQYTMQEIVDAGHGFFGSTTGGFAKVVEKAFQRYGLPNGYILGQEGAGAFMARAISTPRMPASIRSSGRVRRSASIMAARAAG